MTYDEFKDAFILFTGNQFIPNPCDKDWQVLYQHLANSPYTAYEFCYYVAHVYKGEFDPTVLRYKAFMSKQTLWDAFLKYKKERKEEVPRLMKLQLELFDNYNSLYNNPTEILLNDAYDINACLRCELALALDLPDKQKILDKYKALAYYLRKGSPEYDNLLPNLRKL